LSDGIDKCVTKQPLYTQKILSLLATVSENISTHLFYFRKPFW